MGEALYAGGQGKASLRGLKERDEGGERQVDIWGRVIQAEREAPCKAHTWCVQENHREAK